jgi:hypothetical protein
VDTAGTTAAAEAAGAREVAAAAAERTRLSPEKQAKRQLKAITATILNVLYRTVEIENLCVV